MRRFFPAEYSFASLLALIPGFTVLAAFALDKRVSVSEAFLSACVIALGAAWAGFKQARTFGGGLLFCRVFAFSPPHGWAHPVGWGSCYLRAWEPKMPTLHYCIRHTKVGDETTVPAPHFPHQFRKSDHGALTRQPHPRPRPGPEFLEDRTCYKNG